IMLISHQTPHAMRHQNNATPQQESHFHDHH
ncbi:sulfite exporter TauE/SafE family protein, partial [Helicobacter pylori]